MQARKPPRMPQPQRSRQHRRWACDGCAGLTEVMLTGGLAPGITLPCAAADAYRSLFPRVLVQNAKYYHLFPGDVEQVRGQADSRTALDSRTLQSLHTFQGSVKPIP